MTAQLTVKKESSIGSSSSDIEVKPQELPKTDSKKNVSPSKRSENLSSSQSEKKIKTKKAESSDLSDLSDLSASSGKKKPAKAKKAASLDSSEE